MERERRCRARARVGWAGVDDGRRPRGCELRPCACREQQSAQEREENGKEETGHVARSPFGARSGLGVGGGVQDPTHSRRGCTPVASAKAVPMRTRRGSRSSARGGTTTGLPLSLQARSRGIPRYNVAGGEVLPRPRVRYASASTLSDGVPRTPTAGAVSPHNRQRVVGVRG